MEYPAMELEIFGLAHNNLIQLYGAQSRIIEYVFCIRYHISVLSICKSVSIVL